MKLRFIQKNLHEFSHLDKLCVFRMSRGFHLARLFPLTIRNFILDIIQIIVLAVVQSLTEFLPVSSSAHLVLVPIVTGWQDQGVVFDVALHLGTLLAVITYFRVELQQFSSAWLRSLRTRHLTTDSRLAWGILLATIPAGIFGLVIEVGQLEPNLRSPHLIATTSIFFGILLAIADLSGKRCRDERSLTLRDIILIGCAQAVALIPGTSRSGITMTAGLFLGLQRKAAARFSFLLSVPAILLASTVEGLKLILHHVPIEWNSLILGITISAVTAYLCIYFFLRLLDRIGMLPFVVYRIFLGITLFLLF
jgi:undecaprenyl-diphosphatase